MKQMYLNRINSQVRFENGPKTVRVKSRIGSRLVRKSLDSFLTRFCLISLFLILMGGWSSEVLGNTATSTNKDGVSSNVLTIGGNHATFYFSGNPLSVYKSKCYSLGTVNKNSTREYTLTWTANDGCAISVTGIAFKIQAYNTNALTSSDGTVVFNGKTTSAGTIGDGWTQISETGTFNSGIKITCKNKQPNKWYGYPFDYYIKDISITYTITPNKPGVSPTTETVNVTLPANTANPTTINYKDNFSTSDHYGSYFEYAFDSNPGNAGHMSGDNFYATDSGTYKIKARIKAENNCHEASSWSSNLTITVNPLVPSFTATNGSVDISVGGDIVNADLSKLVSGYDGNSETLTFEKVTKAGYEAVSNATISGNNFSSTKLGTYRVRATYAATKQYRAVSREFDVVVGKRTPTFSWWNEDGATHIYAGDVLTNVAQAQYNGNDVTGLTYSYESSDDDRAVVDSTTIRVPSTGFTVAGTVTITVKTKETSYYKKGEDTHDYYIEPKATPEFWLNNEIDLAASPVQELHLLIGETATMRFVNTDESNGRFTYPIKPSYVSYEHNSDAHTGVITGTVAGNEVIQFHQTGTTTIFDHSRSIHVYVSKHPVNLATTLNGGTWKVDSVYDGTLYSLSDTPEEGEPVQNDVTISSSNKNVVDYVNGHWKAVGAGSATLTIAQKNNDYWTGDTITTTITVEKHTPVITWNLDASYPWGAIIESPVSSSNEELPFTVESNNTQIADYVNGRIEVYNKVGSATFTLTQNGNYKWNAAASNLTKTISVYKPDNHLPITSMTSSTYKHYLITNSSDVSWDSNGYKLGNGTWVYDWAPDASVIITFTGVPDKLTFTKVCDKGGVGLIQELPVDGQCLFEVYESSTNGNWGKPIWSYNKKEETRNVTDVPQLKPSTRYIKLRYHGTIYGHFNNIKITERREIVATPTSYTFPTADVDASAQTLPVQIDWYNVKTCTATIEGANAGFFQLAETAPIAALLDHYGTETLHVTYAYPQAGTHTATLKVQSEDGYMVEVPLSATSLKVTPAITWKENLTPMSRGENVTNPATSPVALTYSSSDPTVVKVEDNVLKPLKKGNATITASFDGTSDLKWNSASSSIAVTVTDMHVQHINWPQTFTRLKYTTNPALSDKNTEDFPLTATVSYYDLDNEQEVVLDRTITFTSGNNKVVTVLSGNILHVVGLGETTLTAHVDGVADEYLEATVTRKVKVREPSTDCDTYIVEDAHASMATGVTSFNGEETVIDLNGQEPGYVSFSAWREIIKVVIEYTGGDLYLSQYVNGQWSNDLWHNGLEVDNPKDFGPIALDRHATKIKLYKKTGSLGIHAFSDCNVTLARYLELDNTEGKTSTDIYFSTTDAKPGVAKTKSFTVNYSNITDQLQVDYEGSDKFSVNTTTIGEECGDKGNATVQVTFLSNDVEHYEGTITIHNLNQSVTVHLSADVDKHHQQITWNPVTELKTTDVVSFDATTSAAAAGLNVRYQVVEGDAATVDAETGSLTIIKDGTVTIKATAEGNDSYYDAEPVSKTFTISKVTPTITTIPMAQTMTMPNTSLADCELTGGAASVEGSFAWADNTINATYNNTGYTVTFTPENTNWYSSVSCVVVVPVNKMVQTITWNFTELEMYPNAQITFDASTNAGLPVSYSSSDETVAYVDGNNKLLIIRGGEVTITASQSGNETYAAAEPVSKTLTINRFAPEIVTLPNASSMKIGRVLSDASLTGGLAQLNNEPVEGSFTWVDGNTTNMNVAGTFTKQVVFNPANSNYYEPVYGMLEVKVEKYKPTITVNTLQGSDLTYGQTVAASTLNGTLTMKDQIKNPSVEVAGSYAWADNTFVPNAGNPDSALVVFTPENEDWYLEVEFKVPVIVNKAVVLNPTAAAEIIYGQSLAYAEFKSTTLNPQTGLRINGTVSLAAYLDQNVCYTEGTYELPMLFRANDANYSAEPVEGIAILTVTPGIVFNGTTGTSWQEASNWGDNDKPEIGERVTINANVDIDEDVKVAGMTINAGYTVTVKSGKTLELGAESSLSRTTYGNIHVEEGGKLILGSGTLNVNNLYLDASLGNNTTPANSGQIRNAAKLAVNGDAYFDLRLDPVKCSYGWYDFTVPFPVDNRTGISRFQNGAWNTALKTEQHYAIMTYHEEIRAKGEYGWKKYYGIMQPGKCYTITVDNTAPLYRFRKVAGAAITPNNLVSMTATTDAGGGDTHKGWNSVGNGTMTHATLSAEGLNKVQVYDHATNAYTTVDNFDTKSFPVGTAVFVQIQSPTDMSFTDVNPALAAPLRTQARSLDEYMLTFALDNDTVNRDYLFLSASEDATADYQIGHDLAKFGTSTTVAQIWADAYGQKLCDVEAPLVADQAIIPISLYAAQTGTYTLETVRGPQDASLYLMYNGAVIWNLSQSAYTFDLTRGTNSAYSLLLTAEAPAISTGCDAISVEKTQQVEKILLNGQLYILRDGQMYDATGKKVK